MVTPPYYNNSGDMIVEPTFGPPPVNLTRFHVKCQRGNIHKLVELGLSTVGSRCPSTSMDDLIKQKQMLKTIATDPRCSFRAAAADDPTTSTQSRAILDHFHSIMGKSSNYFDLNLNTMFTKECYERILELMEEDRR